LRDVLGMQHRDARGQLAGVVHEARRGDDDRLVLRTSVRGEEERHSEGRRTGRLEESRSMHDVLSGVRPTPIQK
jgi:hypothetical protein